LVHADDIGRDPALLATDRGLVAAARALKLFRHVNPVDVKAQRTRFLARPCAASEPRFRYRPLSFDPEVLERSLLAAPIARIEHPGLRRLYEEKRLELRAILRLLLTRGGPEFTTSSLELYGRPPAALVEQCAAVLTWPREEELPALDAQALCAMFRQGVEDYRQRYGSFDCQVGIERDMAAEMYVDENRIRIREGARESRPASLVDLHHELDAHILTCLNGRQQPLRLLQLGLAGSMAYQESLGVFTELASGVLYAARLARLASRVVAVDRMLQGAEFFEIFGELTEAHGFSQDYAWRLCQRIFRGGGFTKDWVYLSQVEAIFRHWAAGRDMAPLLLGKTTLAAVETIAELLVQGLLQPPRYLPPWVERFDRRSARVQALLGRERIGLEGLFGLAKP